ncbi:MAG: Lrp/AsnC family transcriptional regulator [Blastocatellia bacterium]|nr:Lrp/AsnC family transcriptional regulator [Blastocatellia bacterium]
MNNRINDAIDMQILNILQANAQTTNAEIARRVGLAPSAVLERVRKLEEAGVIRGYVTDIDPARMGFGLTAFVFVRTNCGENIDRALTAIPEVLEVHDVAGEDCYLLKVRAESTEALGRLLREKLKSIPEITSTRTTVALKTLKETIALPIPGAGKKEKSPRGGKKR